LNVFRKLGKGEYRTAEYGAVARPWGRARLLFWDQRRSELHALPYGRATAPV